jgi:hypothetical protein
VFVKTASIAVFASLLSLAPATARAQHGGHSATFGGGHHEEPPRPPPPRPRREAPLPPDPPRGPTQFYLLVDEKGYSPSEIPVKAGEVTEVFVMRTTEATCVKEIVVPDLGLRLPLPLEQPVKFSLKPSTPGRITFACAQGHVTGEIVVR